MFSEKLLLPFVREMVLTIYLRKASVAEWLELKDYKQLARDSNPTDSHLKKSQYSPKFRCCAKDAEGL